MPPIEWQPMTPDSIYYATLEDSFEQPDDGYEVVEHWVGVDAQPDPVTGKQRRRYWLQLLARGRNDRKALLVVFGGPTLLEVTQEHVDEAIGHLGWERYDLQPKHRGAAWIIKKFE